MMIMKCIAKSFIKSMTPLWQAIWASLTYGISSIVDMKALNCVNLLKNTLKATQNAKKVKSLLI